MVCIYCDHKTKVINSRPQARSRSTWRRHQCMHCNSVVTTQEQIDLTQALRVENREKRYEPFKRDKLFLSLHRALQHRKTAQTDATALTDTITGRLLSLHTNGLVKAKVIRDSSHQALKRFDIEAATYYAVGHQPARYK